MSTDLGGNDEIIQKARQTTSRLVTLFIILAVAIIGVAIAFTVFRIQSIQSAKGEEMQAIADEKLTQIENWRNERIGDGLVIQTRPSIIRYLKQYSDAPSTQTMSDIDRWLEIFKSAYHYQSYLVFDAEGRFLFADVNQPESIGEHTQADVLQVIHTQQVILSDLYKLDSSGNIRMDLLVPVVDVYGDGRVVGVVVLRIDPNRDLYSFIEKWPVESKTGETVLFMPQGDTLIYLNELRFNKDAALNFSIPIDTPKLPAGLVIKGERGVIFGTDYRGVSVIAVGRHVSDSSWYMVTKEDASEAYAEVSMQAWTLGLIILLVIFVFSVSAFVILRRGKEFYEYEINKVTNIAERLRQSYQLLFDMANDIIIVVDEQGFVVDVNDRAVKEYGYSHEELLQMHADLLRTNSKVRKYKDLFKYLTEHDGIRYESEHIRKGGAVFPVEISMRYYESDGRGYLLCLIRDISQRRQSEILLKENLNALQSIVDASPLGIITTDIDGYVTLWSPAAEQIFGWKEEEVIGKSLVETFNRSADGFALFFENLKAVGKPMQLERNWKRKDGSDIVVSFSAALITDYQDEVNGFLGLVNDITDLKKIEADNEQMAAERIQLIKRMRLQFERMPIGYVLADEKLTVLDWNPQAEKIFGYSRDEIVGKSQFDTIIPQDQKKMVNEMVQKVKNQIASEVVTHQNITKDGRQILVEWHNTSLIDENGKFIALMAMAMDVTEKNEAERLLRESEEKSRAFFDSNLIGIIFADIYGSIYTANDEMLRMIGYSRNELEAGQVHWDKITPEEFLILDQQAIKQALESGSVEPYEKQYIRKDGQKIWVLVGFSIIDKDKGTTIAFVLDITEKKLAEQEFMAYHKLLDLVGEIGKIGGWDFDVTTGSGTWTQEVAMIHDLDPHQQTNRDLGLSFYTPESKVLVENAIQNAIENGTPYNLEVELVSAKGTHKLVRTIGLPLIVDEKVTRMRGIFQDITELKEAEAEVRKLNEELEQRVVERTNELVAANQELEAFSYSVSHDLRAPLRAIDGFSKLLIDEHKDTLTPEMMRYLETIRGNTRNMGQLIDDLLAFSRLGRQPIQRNEVNMKKLVANVIDKVKLDIQARDVEFVIKKLPDCFADETLLNQVYFNLISNAVKFTRTRAKAVITVGYKKAVPHLSDGTIKEAVEAYYVSDNGVGFDMRYYDKLFSVFQRLHKAEEYEGTGVGLAIVKRVIEKHNGLVWAESTLGSGSTIYFSIGKEEEYDQSD